LVKKAIPVHFRFSILFGSHCFFFFLPTKGFVDLAEVLEWNQAQVRRVHRFRVNEGNEADFSGWLRGLQEILGFVGL
jgi:hypothetical protein